MHIARRPKSETPQAKIPNLRSPDNVVEEAVKVVMEAADKALRILGTRLVGLVFVMDIGYGHR